ncbi:hypothetical protein E8E11_007242 [Didymella keratinophila]|nr:hypothetical protein E8E11_007242 [Didymella keratinophila]
MGNYLGRTSSPVELKALHGSPMVPLQRKFSEDEDTEFSWERWDGLYEGYDVKIVGAYVYTKLRAYKASWSYDEVLEVLRCRPCPYGDVSPDLPKMEEWQELDDSEGSSFWKDGGALPQ